MIWGNPAEGYGKLRKARSLWLLLESKIIHMKRSSLHWVGPAACEINLVLVLNLRGTLTILTMSWGWLEYHKWCGGAIKGTGNVCPKDRKREPSGLYTAAFEPLDWSVGEIAFSRMLPRLHLRDPRSLMFSRVIKTFLKKLSDQKVKYTSDFTRQRNNEKASPQWLTDTLYTRKR